MQILKQSTATTVYVGPVLDASGAAVTTAVLGDFRLIKNGTAATLTGATVSHDVNGYYTIALTVTNTDTTGRLTVVVGNTAQSMATHRFTVLLPSVFDAIITNATNSTGGLATATAAITALSGAVSTLTAAQVRTELTVELARIDTTIGSRMATYTQPTGFLEATFPAILASTTNITGATGIVLAPVTHTGARIPFVTLVDTTTVNTDMRGTDGAALASEWTATRAGYMDSVLLALNSNRTVQVTGSHHVAADIHELQPAVIDSTHFAPNWLTAAGTAADYITELQTAIGTATNQTAIKAVTDKVNTGLVADGVVYQFTANMLELAPGGGGGAGDASQATLLQVQSTVNGIASSLSGVPITATGRIADGGTITLYCGDDLRVRSGTQLTLTVTDVGGAIYSRLNTIGTSSLAFGASRRGLPISAISGSIASLTSVGSGASQTIQLVVEIDNAGGSLQPAEDYEWQIESEQPQGAEFDQLVEMAGILILKRRTV